MERRTRLRAATFATLVAALAVPVGATAGERASAPVPDLATMVLAPVDFAAAKVASQRRSTVAGRPTFLRVFRAGAKLGRKALLSVVSQATLYADATGASADLAQIRRTAKTRAGRASLAAVWGRGFQSGGGKAVKLRKTVVGPPIPFGPDALEVPVTFTTNLPTVRMAMGFVQVDRVVAVVAVTGMFGDRIARTDVSRAIGATRTRMRTAFTPASTAPPTIAGTAAQGQTLTVDEGTWTGAPSNFTYAWSRCDAAGANCVPIPDATAASYAVSAVDAGTTLSVTVTGANSVGEAQASSAPTAVVQ